MALFEEHKAFYQQKQGKLTKKKMQSIFFEITDSKLTTGALAANALKYIKTFIDNKEWETLPTVLKKDLIFTVQADLSLYNQYIQYTLNV